MTRAYDEWRILSPQDRKRIHCTECNEPAKWCNQWATALMAAPAFYYYCQEHAAQRM